MCLPLTGSSFSDLAAHLRGVVRNAPCPTIAKLAQAELDALIDEFNRASSK